mmetsp:Transcript_7318/g.22664  ORF Transcript_7318/g.22664 Transcript_7318/m.22664 type:complete len:258 (-) Transcript_7318:70-843(-)
MIEVLGAGNPEANGRYIRDRSDAGTVRYRKLGCPSWAIVAFKATQWRLGTGSANKCAYFLNGSTTDNDGAPPLSGWQLNTGDSLAIPPVPELRLATKRTRADDVTPVQERLWQQRKFTDAEVVCAGERMAVHRAQLSAASPVFEAAFMSDMQEGQRAVFEIKESTPAAVEAMLHYIYTGSVGTASPELLDLAVQYQLDSLVGHTAHALVEDVNTENVRERMLALKRHSGSAPVAAALKEMVQQVLADKSGALYLASV